MGVRYLTLLARQAEEGKLSRIVGGFILSLVLLSIPVMVVIIRSPPHELFGRYYGVDFSVFEGFAPQQHDIAIESDGAGFIASIQIGPAADGQVVETPGGGRVVLAGTLGQFDALDEADPLYAILQNEPVLGITDEFFFYIDGDTQLVMPVERLPRVVLDEWDARELFDHLALNNAYFSRFMFPTMLLVVGIAVFMVLGLTLIVAAIFGMTRILTHKMSAGKRARVMMTSAYPVAVLCCLVGFFIPVMHLFIFQLLHIFVALGVSKRI